MALDRQIARLSRVLVDKENISFDEAQARLRALTLEIVVGAEATSPAAQAAILTAVSVGSRTFIGGVRLTGAVEQPLSTAIPLATTSLAEVANELGGSHNCGDPSRRILVGTNGASKSPRSVFPWWNGWHAGVSTLAREHQNTGCNPLPGIAAGALAVGVSFDAERGHRIESERALDLWPCGKEGTAPDFGQVFLPNAIWLIGLGNLGQAFLWALSALPYSDPPRVSLLLQDRETITEENWGTSVLVKNDSFGILKTKAAEEWASAKGFKTRRVDRHLVGSERLDSDDPRLALSGVDRIAARKLMADIGFDCIVDAGLGRKASDFDRFRVSVFDRTCRIDKHFAGLEDQPEMQDLPSSRSYRDLEAEIGPCGTAEIAGASVAAPYVSALAAAVAISRAIAVTSGCVCPSNEVAQVSQLANHRIAPPVLTESRGIGHAGNPIVRSRAYR